MTISSYNKKTHQRAVSLCLCFEELTDGSSTKAAALRAVKAVDRNHSIYYP